MNIAGDMEDAARGWAIRASDPAFADWDGLMLWLESDAAHLAAYEAVLDQVDRAAALLEMTPELEEVILEPLPEALPEPQPVAEVEEAPARRRWWAAGGIAVAASVAVAFGWTALTPSAAPEWIATAPGEHRTVALADGSQMVLNGGTRVLIDRADPRRIELAEGEALFTVRHDERHPFVVVSGDTRLLDAGTVFNVVADKGAIDVAVAEGAVIYQPGPRQVRLNAGDALSRRGGDAAPMLRRAAAQDVGSWQSGELRLDSASLDEVARGLSRNLGRPVRAAGGGGDFRFTGTLVLRGKAEEVLARAGPLLGVRFTPDGEGWTMTPANGPPS